MNRMNQTDLHHRERMIMGDDDNGDDDPCWENLLRLKPLCVLYDMSRES